MSLHFKHGALTEQQRCGVENFLKVYPYAAFFSKQPVTRDLKEHDRWHEPDMGHGYIRKTQLWGIINDLPYTQRLIFCYDPEDYEKLIAQTDILIDANPFETFIQDTRPQSIKLLEQETAQKIRDIELDRLRRLTFWERVRAVFSPTAVVG